MTVDPISWEGTGGWEFRSENLVGFNPECPEMRSISHKNMVIPCGHMGKAHILCGFV
jgi:hypothetical protein